jgi:hypothetical protein
VVGRPRVGRAVRAYREAQEAGRAAEAMEPYGKALEIQARPLGGGFASRPPAADLLTP